MLWSIVFADRRFGLTSEANIIYTLLDPQIYRKQRKDPTALVLRRTYFFVKWTFLAPDVKAAVWCSGVFPPRLYGFPKIHKASVPLRPIVSAIGLPTYNLVKHMTTLLQLNTGLTESYVPDSTHFLEKLGVESWWCDDEFWHHLTVYHGFHSGGPRQLIPGRRNCIVLASPHDNLLPI